MSLLFLDSFDHYSTADITRKWNTNAGSIVTDGRTGKGLLNTGSQLRRSLVGAQAELAVGMAYRLKSHNTLSSGIQVIRLENITFGATLGLYLLLRPDLKFNLVFSGDAVTVGGIGPWPPYGGNIRVFNEIYSPASSLSIDEDRWYYIELHSTVGLRAGSGTSTELIYTAEAYLNETLMLSASQMGEVNPLGYNVATVKYQSVALQGAGSPGAILDDVYITDAELLGDIKVGVLYPNAAGSIASMTPNAAGANYSKVNEHTPDDDATYVSAASVGQVDLYNLDDIGAFTGTIKGAQACVLARKSDVGPATIQAEWYSGSTTFNGQTMNPSATDYLYLVDPRRKSVFTSADWTPSEIDAIQVGQKRTA